MSLQGQQLHEGALEAAVPGLDDGQRQADPVRGLLRQGPQLLVAAAARATPSACSARSSRRAARGSGPGPARRSTVRCERPDQEVGQHVGARAAPRTSRGAGRRRRTRRSSAARPAGTARAARRPRRARRRCRSRRSPRPPGRSGGSSSSASRSTWPAIRSGLVVQQRRQRVDVDRPARARPPPRRTGWRDRPAGDQGDAPDGGQPGKARRSTNRSLKSARSESSTYVHLLQQRQRAGALADAQQAHLRALAGDVAGRDDPQHRDLRHQTDAHRGRGGEVAAERAGQQHLLHVALLEAELLEQQRPAGGDRALGELQLADVALGEVDRLLGGRVGLGPVQHEHPLLADGGRAGRRRAARSRVAPSSVTNRPEASSRPARTSSETASTSPEPHRPRPRRRR